MGAHDTAETQLREDREHLMRRLNELGATEDGALSDDVDFGEGFADAAAATAERTEVIGLVESLRRSLAEVDLALARIAEGTYGTCSNCGKEIGEARLEFRPASSYCVECKSAEGH